MATDSSDSTVIPAPATPAATATSATPSVASATAATGSIPNLRDRIPKLQPRRRAAPPPSQTPAPLTPTLPPPSTAGLFPSILSQDASTPSPSTDAEAHQFSVPHRRILSLHDHELFLASPTCLLLQAWVFGLADSVVDTPAGVFAEALAAEADGSQTAEAADAAPVVPGQWRPQQQQRRTYQKNVTQRPLSRVVLALLSILDDVQLLVYANPPDEAGGSRFGNKRFRGFVDQVRQQAPRWHREKLGMGHEEKAEETDGEKVSPPTSPVVEASTYLGQAFGNRARIDYGSGHELHFVVWLLCLYQLGLVSRDDMPALVLCVFARYLDVMRLVQTTYYLEPAGSHGVWGLDDYQFLPFLFGAAQLLHHRYITPRAVHQQLTLEQFGDDYLYLGQVRFVNSIKVATAAREGGGGDDGAAAGAAASGQARRGGSNNSLRWHSPMLDDISAAKSWEKIEGGMRRMFLAEVLSKLPVMQHFLFGSLVSAAPDMTEAAAPGPDGNGNNEDADSDEDDAIADGNDSVDVFDKGGVRHIHSPSGWGDCCGIRVPSSLGAAGEMRKHGGEVLRRIPFD